MREYGLRVQKGSLALDENEAKKVAAKLDPTGGLILKSQVHAGGRGKGTLSSGLKGGVKICKTPEEVANYTKQMIGYNLVTPQTPKDGLKVNAVLVHEGVDINKQYYLAVILDRNTLGPAFVASKYGGMEIEEVAKTHPDSILVQPVDISKGLQDDEAMKLAKKLEIDPSQYKDAVEQMKNLYKMFIAMDSTQVEINPWATDPKGKLWMIDAKINIDDNAKFRQERLVKLRKESVASEQTDPSEEKALAAGLNYVALDGNIGCMVNGAGLAMATMDIVKLHGGSPANFLDVGGGANVEQVKTAFEILSNHPSVKTIFINIFGGIMKCDVIAQGIIKAAQLVDLKVPLVCRLHGTNAAEGKKLLEEFNAKYKKLTIIVGNDLDDGAKKAVAAAAKMK
jgi:succinyl-CoA synthetase beta subunit